MTNRKNMDLALMEVKGEPYARDFRADEIEQALASAIEVFADLEQSSVPGFCGVIVRPNGPNGLQRPTSFAKELIPGFLYAHRYFGKVLPVDLLQKLTNQSQTHDTLFELNCMGFFQQDHAVRYEPKLADGKVPDLMLNLARELDVYVECKSQRIDMSKHVRVFADAASQIHSALDLEVSTFVKNSWTEGFRIEVKLLQSPSSADIREMAQRLDGHEPNAELSEVQFGKAITVSLIARDEPFDKSLASPSAVMRVDTTPTQVHHKNVHVAVYPWRRLDSIRRQSQRRLLKSARQKLKSMPEDAYGLICIQTTSSMKFAPDIHELLKQTEYERIPIVWLNPIGGGQLIYRNDAIALRGTIFDRIIERANASRQESQGQSIELA